MFATLTADPAVRAALATGFDSAYDGAQVAVFPEISDLLDYLHRSGVAIALVTSKARSRYTADLAGSGLAGLVGVAVCAEDVERGKPDPEPVRRALTRLGVGPADAVLVGDGVADIRAAVAAGVPAIGVGWGFTSAAELRAAGARAVADDVAGLRSLLRCPVA